MTSEHKNLCWSKCLAPLPSKQRTPYPVTGFCLGTSLPLTKTYGPNRQTISISWPRQASEARHRRVYSHVRRHRVGPMPGVR